MTELDDLPKLSKEELVILAVTAAQMIVSMVQRDYIKRDEGHPGFAKEETSTSLPEICAELHKLKSYIEHLYGDSCDNIEEE